MMIINKKKLASLGLGKKLGFLLTIQNIKLAMVMFDKLTRHLDDLEEKGHIGSWNSGKKFSLIKRINSRLITLF